MAKRFTSTEIWDEDWFLDMTNEYKLFWYYILSACDHAGLFRVNASKFNRINHASIKTDEALRFFNEGKERIKEITKSVWLIEDFFVFQYGKNFNINNPMHKSIYEKYNCHNISLLSIRGLGEVNLTSKKPLKEVYETTKDKDKDIDKDIKKGGVGENKKNGKVRGVSFVEEGNAVVLEDGTIQELGEIQKFKKGNQALLPKDILKGEII